MTQAADLEQAIADYRARFSLIASSADPRRSKMLLANANGFFKVTKDGESVYVGGDEATAIKTYEAIR